MIPLPEPETYYFNDVLQNLGLVEWRKLDRSIVVAAISACVRAHKMGILNTFCGVFMV